jgi:flavin reductase (DIM6/NTAB) family NADH-FMN oxidoreductase RutF
MNSISNDQFRSALGNYVTGVTIVTTLGKSSRPVGMTANSFASVSLDPPLVLWSIDKSAPEAEDFVAASHYAIHILNQDQRQLSHTFANDSADKFADLPIEQGISGLPLLNQFAVRLQCEISNRHDEGDHIILIGKVLDVCVQDTDPLVFFNGYARLQS